MSKGSKQRPTAQSFYDNWDDIFGEDDEDFSGFEWECLKCEKGLDEDDLYIVEEINHEPMGDRIVERIERMAHCNNCGQEAEYAG